jgi:uncharacterized protein YjiK
VLSEERIAAREGSGVAVHPAGVLLIVDDEVGIYAHVPGTAPKAAPLEPADGTLIAGAEGIALAGDGRTVFVVSEDSREVLAFGVTVRGKRAALGKARSLGKLPRLGKKRNKGWEGIAVRPARFDPDGEERLVAVHEGKPRQVGIFSFDDLEAGEVLDLPAELDSELEDLSDVAVDPRTGRIYLLSDQSSSVAEVEVVAGRRRTRLEVRAVARLPIEEGLKPEGMDIDDDGTLWLVTEEDRTVRRIALPSTRLP